MIDERRKEERRCQAVEIIQAYHHDERRISASYIIFRVPKRLGGVTRNMSITEYPKNHHGITCFGNDKEWPGYFCPLKKIEKFENQR